MAKGISVHGDVLISKLKDGTDLNDIWAEVQEVTDLWNNERKSITDLLSFKTTEINDVVPQSWTTDKFEESTELGIPRAIRPPSDWLKLGYPFKDFDLRTAFTWKFLRDATAEQVRAHVTRALEADNALTTNSIMNRLFNPALRSNDWGNTVYGLWSADGTMTPPPYRGNIFDSSHSHYLPTGHAGSLAPGDVEALQHHVEEHGYNRTGSTLLILLNDEDFEASRISSWRAGKEISAGGPIPKWDFIASTLMPAWLSNETVHGEIPDPQFNGLDVWGSYGNALVIKSLYIPRNYVVVVATGGPNSDVNPVGFREHVSPEWQGLRHIPGNGSYPLQDSYFLRSFGVGVRHRSAAVVAQITSGSTYTPPVFDLAA